MLTNLGIEKIGVLLVVGLVVLGPERLPKLAADAGRLIRRLRRLAQDASTDLKAELGPEFADLNIGDLHPRRFIERHLLSEDDPSPVSVAAPVRPLAAGERPPFDREAT